MSSLPEFSRVRILVSCLLLLIAQDAIAGIVSVSPAQVYQGNAFLVLLKTGDNQNPPEAKFENRPVYFSETADGRYIGMGTVEPRLKPAVYTVSVALNGETHEADVTVLRQDFPVERLSLPEKQVSLSPEDSRRAQEEAARLGQLWPQVSEVRWTLPFHLPVDGNLGTRFGTRRILNGLEKNPHNGQDIKAPRGTPVRAISTGRVVFREDLFFGGNTLVLDHGGGLFSFYMHLEEFLVNEGQNVDTGTAIATVGSTGRSTGPHLHVGMKLGGVNLNPVSVVDLHSP